MVEGSVGGEGELSMDGREGDEFESVNAPAAFKSDVWKHFGFTVSRNERRKDDGQTEGNTQTPSHRGGVHVYTSHKQYEKLQYYSPPPRKVSQLLPGNVDMLTFLKNEWVSKVGKFCSEALVGFFIIQ